MALVCLLYFSAGKYNINVCIAHIASVDNEITDSLSHYQQDRFKQQALQANPVADSIPAWPTQSFIDAS